MQDLLGWAERFIATPSVSRDGNREVANLAAELLCGIGLSVRLQPAGDPVPFQANVIAEAGPRTGRDLLLLTHLDTVPPGNPALWTKTGGDPFAPTRRGDRLYGLGSADAKVDLVCKAFALGRTNLDALRRRVRVVATFGEEIGLRGTRHLLETGEAEGLAFALVGEPSELVGIRAHKGYAVFEARVPLERLPGASGKHLSLELHGESVHSSTPALGRNAVEAALERIAEGDVRGLVSIEGGDAANRVPSHCRLELLVEGGEGDVSAPACVPRPFDPAPLVAFHRAWRRLLDTLRTPRDPSFDPDHTVASLGPTRIEGDETIVTFDLRPILGVDPGRIVAPLGAQARLRCLRSNPPLDTPEDSALVRALRGAQAEAGLEPRIGTKATCTEAGLLSAAGLEAVVFGAGTSVGNVHRPNEHTRISELHRAVEIYGGVVRRLCIEEEGPCSS